jgi:hypothetical protein
MALKYDNSEFSMRQSAAYDSWCRTRDHKALLRSTGHLFRDGRYLQDDDDFHVYWEIEHPAFGEQLTFTGHPSYLVPGSGDPFGYEQVPITWKPAISRSVESIAFDPTAYKTLPDIVDPDFADFTLGLNAQGTAFIVKNRPGNPQVHLGQYMVELRELPSLPMFLQRRAKVFRDLGSEYLNIEFGWLPFIGDLQKIHQFSTKVPKVLAQLVRDNGLKVRRRSKKRVTTESSLLCEGTLSVPFGDLSDTSIGGDALMDGYHFCGPFGGLVTYPNFPGQADYRLSSTEYGTEWECGTFRYFVPDIGSSQWTNRAIKILYGGDPSPSTIWSVIPWTWLIDWFANVGDILSNLTSNAVDNETLENAYAMYTKTVYDVVELSAHWDEVDASSLPGTCFFLPNGSVGLTHTVSRVNKFRHQASPFGFGLKRADFTARQLAILAALLTSKAKPNRRGSVEQILSYR